MNMIPTYTQRLNNGGYEYGYVIQHRSKPDELIPMGTTETYEEAARKLCDWARTGEAKL